MNKFRVLLCIACASTILLSIISCANSMPATAVHPDFELMAENDQIALYREKVSAPQHEFDISEYALWLEQKSTGQQTKILTTVRPDWHAWYIADGKKFVDVPIDSILALNKVTIFNSNPLQIIVEGCPDFRNVFSYFIDVPSRTAWWVPANSGYMGGTEEGYMIFSSYRYVSDPEIAGRYTFLQIFDQDGTMVDSLDLEHVILSRAGGH